MTVRQNLLVATHSVVRHAADRDDLLRHVLAQCALTDKSERLAGSLGLLDLKRLEVARAFSLRPRLLLLDEVAAGLVGVEVQEITQLIASVHEQGRTILLIEHVQALIQALATRVIVLEQGRTIAAGTPRQIADDPTVVAAYLGTSEGAPEGATHDSPPDAPRPARARPAILQLDGVSVDYGKLRALQAIDLQVHVGRPATNGGHRTGADGGTAPDYLRRAFARACTPGYRARL
jgi:branched-chain amino acid transport system ATP-binding protein